MPLVPTTLASDEAGTKLGRRTRRWSDRSSRAAFTLASAALLALLTAIVVMTGQLGPLDGWVLRGFSPVPRSGPVLALVTALCVTATAPAAVAFLMALGSWLTVRRRSLAPLATTSVASGLLVAGVLLMKWAVGRARPPLEAAVDPEPGFPSGHTTTAVVLVGLLLTLLIGPAGSAARRRLGVLAAASYVIGIGVARLYLGVHWLSDVLGGVLLGLTIVGVALLIVSTGAARLAGVESRLWPS